jgi:hypothetical protein
MDGGTIYMKKTSFPKDFLIRNVRRIDIDVVIATFFLI